MIRKYIDLPLHFGSVPRWLFEKMKRLSRAIIQVIIYEYGTDELLRRISDPFWFQAFGCVLGFDWHSSGLTTTVCGAMKEGIKDINREIGFFIAGGKGAVACKTPEEISYFSDVVNPRPLIYASRISAKVDNTALQDGYQLYHHNFFFTKDGKWAVVQQGMNPLNRYARRYHWLSELVNDFTNEPHSAIYGEHKERQVFNLVAGESKTAREISTKLACEFPEKVITYIRKIQGFKLPQRHKILIGDISPTNIYKILLKTYEKMPENFEKLLDIEGVGPKTIRALALISEIIFGTKISYEDPMRFSFAHGGKDGHPYRINKRVYENSINFLTQIIDKVKLNDTEKLEALRRLHLMNS